MWRSVLGSSSVRGAHFQPLFIHPFQSHSMNPRRLEQPADAVRSCLVGVKWSWLVLGASPW